jgi:AAA ATPase domain
MGKKLMRLLRVYIDGYRNLKNVTVDFDKDSLTTVVIGENGSGKSNLIEAIVEVFRAWDLGCPADISFQYRLEYKIKNAVVGLQMRGTQISFSVRFLPKPSTEKMEKPVTIQGLFFDGTNSDTVQGVLLGKAPASFQIFVSRKSNDPWSIITKELAHIVSDDHINSDFENHIVDSRALFPRLIFGYYSGAGRRLESSFDAHQARYYGVINKERSEKEYVAARKARRLFYCRPIHGVLALLAYFAKPG